MPELDILQQALQQLQQELSGFKSAKHLLDEARENADSDLRRWEQQQTVNAEERAALIEDVKKTREAAVNLVNQSVPLAERMVAVANAVDAAGFPHRLELLRSNAANAVTAIQSLQSRLDLLEVNQRDAIKLAVNELKAEGSRVREELITNTLAAIQSVQESAVKLASELKTEVSRGEKELAGRLELLQTNTANTMAAVQSLQSRLDLLEVNQGNAIKLAMSELKAEVSRVREELAGGTVRFLVAQIASCVLLLGVSGVILWLLLAK